jgi:hypothetical protein
LGPSAFNHRLVGLDRCLEGIDLGLLPIDDLLGLEAADDQRPRARQVLLGGNEVGLILAFFGSRLVERGLEQARIDLGQHVAHLHVLAFAKGDLDELAVDL